MSIDDIIQAEKAGYADGFFGHRNIAGVYREPQAYRKSFAKGRDKLNARKSTERKIRGIG